MAFSLSFLALTSHFPLIAHPPHFLSFSFSILLIFPLNLYPPPHFPPHFVSSFSSSFCILLLIFFPLLQPSPGGAVMDSSQTDPLLETRDDGDNFVQDIPANLPRYICVRPHRCASPFLFLSGKSTFSTDIFQLQDDMVKFEPPPQALAKLFVRLG